MRFLSLTSSFNSRSYVCGNLTGFLSFSSRFRLFGLVGFVGLGLLSRVEYSLSIVALTRRSGRCIWVLPIADNVKVSLKSVGQRSALHIIVMHCVLERRVISVIKRVSEHIDFLEFRQFRVTAGNSGIICLSPT